jgi:DNA gyrase inhibitor GyrI
MATLDDINILDRVKTDPQLLLQAGRQPTVERVKPTFNPASDYFYNNVLNDSGRRMVDFASAEVNNSFNFGITGPINKANKVDYFYNNVLNDSGRRMVDFASAEVNNPFNFGMVLVQ